MDEPRVSLTHIKWNLQDPNLMAVCAEDYNNVLLFDKRRPNQIFDKLVHTSKVNAIAWSPDKANMICSVSEGGAALIWDLNDSGAGPVEAENQTEGGEQSKV